MSGVDVDIGPGWSVRWTSRPRCCSGCGAGTATPRWRWTATGGCAASSTWCGGSHRRGARTCFPPSRSPGRWRGRGAGRSSGPTDGCRSGRSEHSRRRHRLRLLRWDAAEAGRDGRGSLERAISSWRFLQNLYDAAEGVPAHARNDVQGRAVVLSETFRGAGEWPATPLGPGCLPRRGGGAGPGELAGRERASPGRRSASDVLATFALAFLGAFLALGFSGIFRSVLGGVVYVGIAVLAVAAWLVWVRHVFIADFALDRGGRAAGGLRAGLAPHHPLRAAHRAPDARLRLRRAGPLREPGHRRPGVPQRGPDAPAAPGGHPLLRGPRGVPGARPGACRPRRWWSCSTPTSASSPIWCARPAATWSTSGDALIAFWGAPVRLERHAAVACRTALAIRRELARLGPEWQRRFGADVRARMALHSGRGRGRRHGEHPQVELHRAGRAGGGGRAAGAGQPPLRDLHPRLGRDACAGQATSSSSASSTRSRWAAAAMTLHELIGRPEEVPATLLPVLAGWSAGPGPGASPRVRPGAGLLPVARRRRSSLRPLGRAGARLPRRATAGRLGRPGGPPEHRLRRDLPSVRWSVAPESGRLLQDDLHPAVHRPSGGLGVARHRGARALALGRDAV